MLPIPWPGPRNQARFYDLGPGFEQEKVSGLFDCGFGSGKVNRNYFEVVIGSNNKNNEQKQ
jgi:hypothetical protein